MDGSKSEQHSIDLLIRGPLERANTAAQQELERRHYRTFARSVACGNRPRSRCIHSGPKCS